jgi:hypothetical protein
MNKILAGSGRWPASIGLRNRTENRANAAPNANLLSYKTYSIPPKLGTDRGDVQTPLTGYFKEAVRREMDARGYSSWKAATRTCGSTFTSMPRTRPTSAARRP